MKILALSRALEEILLLTKGPWKPPESSATRKRDRMEMVIVATPRPQRKAVQSLLLYVYGDVDRIPDYEVIVKAVGKLYAGSGKDRERNNWQLRPPSMTSIPI